MSMYMLLSMSGSANYVSNSPVIASYVKGHKSLHGSFYIVILYYFFYEIIVSTKTAPFDYHYGISKKYFTVNGVYVNLQCMGSLVYKISCTQHHMLCFIV